jgi:flagellar biosynthesis/type III secretory pathway protein FliH
VTERKKDILQESWVYWEIAREFYEEGFKQGYEEAVKERRQRWIQESREAIMAYVQAHFLELVALAKQQVDTITGLDALRKLFPRLIPARPVEEARHILTDSVMIELE